MNNTEKNLNFKIHYIKNSNLIIIKMNPLLPCRERALELGAFDHLTSFWSRVCCSRHQKISFQCFRILTRNSIKKLGQEHPLFCSLSITLFIHLYKIDFITKCRIVINHVTFCVDSMNYMSMTIMSVLIF